MRIAIVTASIGHGHNSVAFALKEALLNENSNNCVEVFDILDDSKLYQLVTSVYLEVISKTPYLYSKVFHWSQHYQKTNSIVNLLSFLSLKILKNIKSSFQPDAFIFTHPIPAMCYNNNKLRVPAYTVITDYAYHHFWFNPKVAGYFVASPEIKRQLEKNKFPSKNIFNTGLPIKKSFTSNNMKNSLHNSNISEKPLVLVMGGGFGIGPLKGIVDELEKIQLPFQAVVITGKNESLYQDILKSIENKTKDRWKVISFTDEIHTLMKKSSLLISKAGAITLTEAQISGLPTIIYKPIPGHEEENARFVCQQGWATWVKKSEELISITSKLLSSAEELEAMKKKSSLYSKPFAASNICRIISNYIEAPLRRSL
ncbi:glycosyltransferase [Alkaliphilus pronyensis]|uniref:Glycosyltransferase n=1 Tax=Alkaliphilus pronyensis TaxID=1482732 RepID=A0A6I0FB27_9FIRM|nr:glycosyltransferase [Alkaliphilus pronyensis]KAB3535746.1 glycosyltransferase [Alkaliphilus pronyensis]